MYKRPLSALGMKTLRRIERLFDERNREAGLTQWFETALYVVPTSKGGIEVATVLTAAFHDFEKDDRVGRLIFTEGVLGEAPNDEEIGANNDQWRSDLLHIASEFSLTAAEVARLLGVPERESDILVTMRLDMDMCYLRRSDFDEMLADSEVCA